MKEKILLSLLIPYLAIGAVVCNEVDGKMVCSGTGQLEADIGGNYLIITNLVVTNVLGVCTNCVNMSPSYCENIKSFLSSGLEEANYKLEIVINQCDQITDDVNSLWDFLYDNLSSDSYNEISSTLNNIYFGNESNKSELYVVRDLTRSVSSDVGLIDCSDCQMYSPTVVTNNNYIVITNQGSITSGNWATYDQMEALTKSVKDIQTFVRNIKGQIEKQHATISNFWKETHRDLQGISNLVHRLDDYVLGDYSNSVVHITQNMIMLTNELSNIQRRFFVDYKNITDESNIDDRLKSVLDAKGNWDTEELALHTNWFDRIELYLARIAGVQSSTDEDDVTVPESPVDTSQLDEQLQKAEEVKDDVTQLQTTEENRFEEIRDSISSIFQSFSDFVKVTPTKAIDIISNASNKQYNHLKILSDVDIFVDTEKPLINKPLKIFRLATSAFWIVSIAALSIYLLLQIYSGLKKLFMYVLQFVNALYGSL